MLPASECSTEGRTANSSIFLIYFCVFTSNIFIVSITSPKNSALSGFSPVEGNMSKAIPCGWTLRVQQLSGHVCIQDELTSAPARLCWFQDAASVSERCLLTHSPAKRGFRSIIWCYNRIAVSEFINHLSPFSAYIRPVRLRKKENAVSLMQVKNRPEKQYIPVQSLCGFLCWFNHNKRFFLYCEKSAMEEPVKL